MNNDEANDSVTLRDILARLWRDRGYVVALPVLGLLLGLALMAVSVFRAERPVAYYITLNNIKNPDEKDDRNRPNESLFNNTEKASYPNGTAFEPSDIVSPPVLQRLKSELNLGDGINLGANIHASFDSPLAESITRVYRDRLQARNLSQVDIEAINQAFSKRLDSIISKSVRIDVNYAAMGLDEAQGKAIARALPELWADVYTRQFRTLVSKDVSATIPQSAITDFQNPTGVLSVDSRLSEILRGLKTISEDNRLSSVQDSQGNTAADLTERTNLYADVYFAPVFATYVGGDSLVSNIFLRDQGLRVEQYRRQVTGIDEAISKLQTSTGLGSTAQSQGDSVNQPALQLDSSALDRIVGLSQRASSVEYLRDLLDKRQEATEQMAMLQRKVELARLPSSLEGARAGAALEQQAFDRFAELTGRYNELLTAARQRAEDRSGVLFQPMSSPQVEGELLDPRYASLAVALALAGLLLACAYAILRGPVEKRTERKKA